MTPASKIGWQWLGRIRHSDAVAEMEARRARILDGDDTAQRVLLAEHPPVITLGRAAKRDHVLAGDAELARMGIEVARASRGGEVTLHGPGQLMIYPVVRVRRGLIRFLEDVATAIADVAGAVGVPGARWQRNPAGVWLGDRKLAACGVHVRRGVAIHGFAFDVSTAREMWQLIVPCGSTQRRTASLAGELGDRCPSVEEMAHRLGPMLSARLSGFDAAP